MLSVVSQLTKSRCFVSSMLPIQKATVPLLKGQRYVGALYFFKSSLCVVLTCVLFIYRPMSLISTRFGFDISVVTLAMAAVMAEDR